MIEPNKILKIITEERFLPLFSSTDIEESKKVLNACYQSGIRVFEFTNRYPNSPQLFSQLKKYCETSLPGMLLGIGTIKNAAQAKEYIDIGADFLISPLVLKEIFLIAQKQNMIWIPGCATATEIGMAENLEIKLVKIFPARQLGGPAFIKAVKSVFPDIMMIATGGVLPEEDDLHLWFDSGVTSVGIGSQLFPIEILNDSNTQKLEKHLVKIRQLINKL